MQRVLENLRSRPTHEKRRISLHIAAGVTAAVFLVWVSTLGVRLAGSTESEVTAQSQSPSPFVAAVAAAGGAVKEQVSKATELISSAGSGDVSWSMEEGGGAGAESASAPATVLGTANASAGGENR